MSVVSLYGVSVLTSWSRIALMTVNVLGSAIFAISRPSNLMPAFLNGAEGHDVNGYGIEIESLRLSAVRRESAG